MRRTFPYFLFVGSLVSACGGSDATEASPSTDDTGGADTASSSADSSTDSAAPDSTATDTSVADSAGGDATDGGEGGVTRPCVPDVDGTTGKLTGFDVKTIASGAPLIDPADVAFGFDGKMYVSNSRSATTMVADPAPAGDIVRVAMDGVVTTYLSDMRLRGPYHLTFVPGGAAGGPGILHVGLEDLRDSLTNPTDVIFAYDGTTGAFGPAAYEPDDVERGPGGAFGDFVYFVSRESTTTTTPNSAILFRIESGVAKKMPITAKTGGAAITGLLRFDWAHGASLGDDLYVTTRLDPLSTGSEAAIFRVDSTFEATKLVSAATGVLSVAASPSPTGPFGDFLYVGFGTDLKRVDAAGTVTTVVSGFGDLSGMAFGPDGALYVADSKSHRVRRVDTCKP